MNPDSRSPILRRDSLRTTSGLLAVGGLVTATFLAFANGLGAPFLFDDFASIVDNPTIRRLWPLSGPLSPPAEGGLTVSGRPLLNLSLAFNYAIGGLDVRGYRFVNIAIHAAAAVMLYLLVRRTMRRGASEDGARVRADVVGFCGALLWAVHPLQTESVTYVVQRAESLMGLGVLSALWAWARGLDSPRPWGWWLLATALTWLSVAAKEVAVLIPVLALAYDRTFVAGSIMAAWKARARGYLLLLSAWLPLAWLVLGTGGNRGNTMGFGVALPWTDYLATQPEAWVRYLTLSVWPASLIFDYGKPTAVTWFRSAGWLLLLLPLAGAGLVAWRRRHSGGFLGAAFAMLLAPTSLVPSVVQAIVEHRMYLPLAAVTLGVVGWLSLRLKPRVVLAAVIAVAVALGITTVRRNSVYTDEEMLWKDTIAKRPENARAYNNLGRVLQQKGRDAEAAEKYATAVELDPGNAQAIFNLGLAHFRLGDPAVALPYLERAVSLIPEFGLAHLNRGLALIRLGRRAEARLALEDAVRYAPQSPEGWFHLATLLVESGEDAAADASFSQALGLRDDWPEALSHRGRLRLRRGEVSEALSDLQRARALAPTSAERVFNLGLAEAARGDVTAAIAAYREALRLEPEFFAAGVNLGIALGQAGDLEGAIAQLLDLARRHPLAVEAHANLGTAYLAARRIEQAMAAYERALALAPDDPQHHYNVGYVLLLANRWTEARGYFEHALRLNPEFSAAATMLRNMRTTPRP